MSVESVVFTNAQVLLATSTGTPANDISSLVTSVELSRTYDLLDDTVMGESARSRKAGLETVTANVELIQRFSTSTSAGLLNIDELLQTLADRSSSGKGFSMHIRPVNTTRSASNPEYQFQAVLESYSPIAGAIGEILKTTVPFQSGGGSLSRVTSSS